MTAAAGDTPDKDPSMDDILASIRRIMLDEQARLQDSPAPLAYAAGRPAGASADPVLILDSSMVVEDMASKKRAAPIAEETVIMVASDSARRLPPDRVAPEKTLDARDKGKVPADAAGGSQLPAVVREPEPSSQSTVLGGTAATPAGLEPSQPVAVSAQTIEALVAPAAAAAAAASVEALLKQLSEERLVASQTAAPPSPTIEDVVRAELRPFLKAWLDEHLPEMVERLVRVEITRLIGRSGF